MNALIRDAGYRCWLRYEQIRDEKLLEEYRTWCASVVFRPGTPVLCSAKEELIGAIKSLLAVEVALSASPNRDKFIMVGKIGSHSVIDCETGGIEAERLGSQGFVVKTVKKPEYQFILIAAGSDQGILYGVFHFLRLLQMQREIGNLNIHEAPVNPLRMIDHWDNLDGTVERGYAGKSIFYEQNHLRDTGHRIRDYARLLASLGINAVVINNVNVHREETGLIRGRLSMVVKMAGIFRNYGMKVFLSINFAAPIELGDFATADPLDGEVKEWWRKQVQEIYRRIPDFGGFLVKADSEHRPGPFTYHRNHAEGANMLAEVLKPFGGLLIWRCFVYNCTQDWRDQTTDRAKAAYDNFQPLDDLFQENVILQIKNGPMDFQVREPVSPLFGGMERTNQMIELQITQEYTGQQRHLCYLVPQWKEILDFDTYARGEGSTVKKIVSGGLFQRKNAGFAGVANIGDDPNWTGHDLAQANLYGFGRLAWNPDLTAAELAEEWIRMSFSNDQTVIDAISSMLHTSWQIYESYTAPLGIGWMVNPNYHYGPNVDGYEYSRWGTYHRADSKGIGIDRTVKSGTGFAGQYQAKNALMYESSASCPEELLLFFHHVPYFQRLKSGETVIQHIYNTHFDGVEKVTELKEKWLQLQNLIGDERFARVLARLDEQLEHAKEWRDVINSYFYRKTGIPDELGRKIF
ncbi:alpha-glucuronidase [Hydrogenispora ethanolica]|uniref:Xylan alpha-1,2-glucuronidase n=1 Tax=Hydrogenispora ethanolica TaxID=1082276 RepID=A0A4R1QPH9_HYDET|nr:alpha-glucuronidase family glycosyl hydrolase [Hydrogenispora ethanolica]TCL54225.1 alpha-glucuronidase [Hydrogenispora ethanolica]